MLMTSEARAVVETPLDILNVCVFGGVSRKRRLLANPPLGDSREQLKDSKMLRAFLSVTSANASNLLVFAMSHRMTKDTLSEGCSNAAHRLLS